MKYLIIILLVTSFVLATCEDNQIDINSASLGELDELSGIGEVKAQAIIDTREFSSVDDLIDVYGIGGVTLKKIKDQGLACVEEGEGDVVNEISVENITVQEEIPAKKIETIELYEEYPQEVLIYESKESIILRYLPYVLCVILLIIIVLFLWQRF